MRTALPAAVIRADDPAAANVASTVPAGAKVIKLGDAVLGYEKVPAAANASSTRQKFTVFEMTGRCYRKVLRALVVLRREDGVVIDDPTAWLAVAADIAAAIFGPEVTARNVEGQCLFMGVEFDRTTIVPFYARAAQWRRSAEYAPLSGDEVGRLVKLSWRERDALIEREIGGATRIGSIDETPAERRKRKDRVRRSGQRAAARGPAVLKPWEALGMKKSTYYYHRRSWTDSVRISLKEGKADKNSPTPGNADRDSPTFGPLDLQREDPMGKADKNSPTASGVEE